MGKSKNVKRRWCNEEMGQGYGDVPPNDRRESKGHEAIELEERVKPLAQELIEEL